MLLTGQNWPGILTSFFAYLMVHSGRKAFTNTKSVVIDNLGMSAHFAGSLDAQFMLAYAAGLLTLGTLGDRRNPASLLAFSLVGMAILQLLFSELCVTGISSTFAGRVVLSLVWICDGLVQSIAWPCCVKIVQSSLHGRDSSTLFSFWACNGILGNITCSIIAAIVMSLDPGVIGFRIVFLVTSLCNVIMMVFANRLKNSLSPPHNNDTVQLVESGAANTGQPQQSVSVMECIKTRGVLDYSLCHACIKAVAYAMFFWLPYYLVTVHDVTPSAAAGLSIIYDVATLIGGPTCGFLVERSGKPSTVIAVFVVLAAAPQLLINAAGDSSRLGATDTIPRSVLVNIVLSGFLVGGALNVLSAAVCAKLGGHGSTSTVTGVVDGIGSLGASATQVIIPFLGTGSGWNTVFGLLAALLVASALSLTRIIKDEWSNS